MKKGITIGLALVAIIGMLFVGFAGAAAPVSSGTTNSQDKAVYIDSITTAATSHSSSDGSKILINEINPRGDEHVSLANLGTTTVELNGYQLSVQDGSSFTLPAFSLAPGDEVTVFFTEGNPSRDVIFSGGNSDNVLNDDAGALSLTNLTGTTLSTTTYTNSQSTLNTPALESSIPAITSLTSAETPSAAPAPSSTTVRTK